MKKIIKLTESDLRQIIKRVINEQFDYDYYDIILDLYNEVGIEGMTDDEVEYLKSGGQSNIPDRFLGGDVDIEDEEDEEFEKTGLDTFKEIMESNRHKVVDTAPDGKLRIVFKESPELIEDLSNVIPESLLEVKQGYIIIMDIELRETMVIEVESIIEMTHRVLDLIKVEEMKHHLLDHKEPKLHQLDLNENIDLKHLRLDHKVVDEEHHQEEEVNIKTHHNRWVFIFVYIY